MKNVLIVLIFSVLLLTNCNHFKTTDKSKKGINAKILDTTEYLINVDKYVMNCNDGIKYFNKIDTTIYSNHKQNVESIIIYSNNDQLKMLIYSFDRATNYGNGTNITNY